MKPLGSDISFLASSYRRTSGLLSLIAVLDVTSLGPSSPASNCWYKAEDLDWSKGERGWSEMSPRQIGYMISSVGYIEPVEMLIVSTSH